MKTFKNLILCLLLMFPLATNMSLFAQEIPNDEIWYTSTDGKVVTPNSSGGFDATIVYNVNIDGKGVIKFNGNVTSIGYNAFRGCSSLASITIPNSVTSIGSSAFDRCSSLSSITIPNSVTSIGYSVFWGCSNLKSIIIPNSVTSIGNDAFYGCSSLSAVHISSLESWCKIKFGDSSSNPTSYAHKLYLNNVELKELVIPNSIQTINNDVFVGCSNITSITIPNSVTSIGDGAFSGCSSLVSITIPNSVTSIESYAFSGCSSLASITIPNSVTSIGSSAFYYCSSLASITIPNSVTSIGSSAFSGCSSLASVSNLATTPQTINSNCFTNYSATLHVYEGFKTLYEADAVWGKFTIVDDIPTVKATSIKMDASSYYCELYKTVKTSATVNEAATIKNVTWTSRNPYILHFNDATKGEAIGLKEGVATIVATTVDGSNLSDSAIVYVGNYTPITSITFDKSSMEMMVDETITLQATIMPEEATQKTLTWTSSKTDVATVNENGVITAKEVGETTITATTTDGTKLTATCKITVVKANVTVAYDNTTSFTYLKSDDAFALSDNIKRISITASIPNVNLTYTRNFSSAMVNNWQAWYLPCNVDYNDVSNEYDVAQIYGILMDKAGTVYVAFQKMTDGTVKAHTPYVVRAKSSGEVSINTTTTLMPTADAESFSIQSAFHNFIFNGVYENTIVSAANIYALNEQGSFVKQNTGSAISPFRIQLLLTEREDNPYVAQAMPQEVKIMILDEETGINDVDADGNVDGEIYNLAGQKLQKHQKGINIINGKKVLF